MIGAVLKADKLFGVLLFDPQSSRAASVGSTAEIIDVEKLPDGRMNIFTVGRKRFKVLRTIEDKDYLQGEVEWLEDEVADAEGRAELSSASQQVLDYIRDILRLSSKLTERDVDLPPDLPADPLDLSFWVASTMYGVLPEDQQALLELRNTHGRLMHEAKVLQVTTKFLAAKTALKDAVG